MVLHAKYVTSVSVIYTVHALYKWMLLVCIKQLTQIRILYIDLNL